MLWHQDVLLSSDPEMLSPSDDEHPANDMMRTALAVIARPKENRGFVNPRTLRQLLIAAEAGGCPVGC